MVDDELRGRGRGDGVVGRAVLQQQLEMAAEQAASGVDVTDDHPGHVGVRDAHERERSGLVRDDAHLDVVDPFQLGGESLAQAQQPGRRRVLDRAFACELDRRLHNVGWCREVWFSDLEPDAARRYQS